MVPGRPDDADDVVGDGRIDVDLAHGLLQRPQVLDAEDLLDVVERMRPLLLVEDDDLLDRLGITQAEAQHEPVELRLGRANVPSYSIGFWVAITRNGSGIG